MFEKKLVGSLMGSNNFRTDMPRYADLYMQGRLKLDELVSARVSLDDATERVRRDGTWLRRPQRHRLRLRENPDLSINTVSTTQRNRFVEVMGLRLRVRRQGTGEPMLLINGLGGCLEGWEPLARHLPGRQLIMVDHPGTGLSQVPTQLLSMPQIAAMYVAVLDALKVEVVDVLGFSFGGTVAQQIAKDFPARVRSIVLCGTSVGWGGLPADMITLAIASNPLRYQFNSVREMSAPMLYRGRVGRDPDSSRPNCGGGPRTRHP